MNEEVDKRIVEMQFNNKDFLAKIQATMNALNALDEALEFKNAAEGSAAMKAFAKTTERSMATATESIDSVKVSFSALQVAMATGIAEITRVAMRAGVKIYQLLSAPLNQIITGGKSRSMKIQQAKFMLEGLGIKWEDIQEDINYGVDQTAYGLDAAANVASQLSASGIQIGDEMKTALRGVSGVAAMTSSSYEDIGRIFTTVAGNGRLMGDQLLQLSSRGLNAAQAIVTYYKEVENMSDITEQKVREMVSRGEIDFRRFAAAMDYAFGEHAKDANNTFTGALDNIKSALSRIGQKFADPIYQGLIPVFNKLREAINLANKALSPLYTQFSLFANAASSSLSEILGSESFLRLVVAIVQDLYSYIRPIFGALNNLGIGRFNSAINTLGDLAEYLRQFQVYGDRAVRLQEIYEAIGDTFKTIWFFVKSIADALSPIGDEISSLFGDIVGDGNWIVMLIRVLNPALRIVIYLISQLVKTKLTQFLAGLKEMMAKINWASVINGLAVIINEAMKLGGIIFNLAVQYLPVIINMIGYVPAIIYGVKSVVGVIARAGLVIIGTIASVASFIFDKINAVRSFFAQFRSTVSNAVATTDSSVRKINESQSRINAGSGSYVLGRQANVLGNISPAALAFANAVESEGKVLSESSERTHKVLSDTRIHISNLSKFVLEVFDIIGIKSENVRNRTVDICETIVEWITKAGKILMAGLQFIGIIFGKILSAVGKFLVNPINAIAIALLAVQLLVAKIIITVFKILDGLAGLISGSNAYEKKLGNAEIIKSVALAVLSLAGLVAVFGAVSYFVDPERLKATLDSFSSLFEFITKAVLLIGAIVVVVAGLNAIPKLIGAVLKGTIAQNWIGKSVLTLSTNIITVMLAFASFFGAIAAVLYVMKDYDFNDLKNRMALLGIAMVVLTSMVIVLMAACMGLNASAKSSTTVVSTFAPIIKMFKGGGKSFTNTVTTDNSNPLMGVIGVIFGVAAFFIALAAAMVIMDQVNPSRINMYFGMLIGMMVALTAMISILLLVAKSFSKKNKDITDIKYQVKEEKVREGSAGASNLGGVGGVILAVAGMFLAMAGAFKILDMIDNQENLIQYALILGIMATVVLACIAVITGIQAHLAKNMGWLKPGNEEKSLAVFESTAKIIKSLSMMFLAIAGSLYIISLIDNVDNAVKVMTGIAVGVLISVISLGLVFSRKSLRGTGKTDLEDIATLFKSLSIFLIAIAGAMLLMAQIGDLQTMIASAAVVGVLILVIAGAIAIISKAMKNVTGFAGNNKTAVFAMLGMMGLTIIAILSLIPIIDRMKGLSLQETIQIVAGISILILALAGAMAIMSLSSKAVSLSGMLGMTLAMGVIFAAIFGLILILESMDADAVNKGLMTVVNITIFVGIVMVALGALGSIMAYVPYVGLAVAVGVAAFAVVAGLILVFAGLFALVTQTLNAVINDMAYTDYSGVSAFAEALLTVAQAIAAATMAFAIGGGTVISAVTISLALVLLAGALSVLGNLDADKVRNAGDVMIGFFTNLANAFEQNANLEKTIWSLIGMLGAVSIAIIVAAVALLAGSISLLASAILLAAFGAVLIIAGDLIMEGFRSIVEMFKEIKDLFMDNLLDILMGASSIVLFGTLLLIAGVFITAGGLALTIGGLLIYTGVIALSSAIGMLSESMNEFDPLALGLKLLEMCVILGIGGALFVGVGFSFTVGSLTLLAAFRTFALAMSVLKDATADYEIAGLQIQNGTDSIVNALERLVDFLDRVTGGNFTRTISSITDVVSTTAETWSNLGSNIISGLADGIQSSGDTAINALSSVTGGMMTAFTSAWDIHSPSRVALTWGQYIDQGLTAGINKGKKGVNKSMTDLASGANEAFKDELGIHSPSAEMEANGANIIEGLMRSVGAGQEDVDRVFEEMGSDAVESFNTGAEEALDDTAIEVDDTPWYQKITSGFSNVVNWIRGAAEGIDVGSFMDKISGIANVVRGFLNGENGEFDLSNVMAVLTEQFPSLFGEGGMLAGTALGDNLISSIMGYKGQVAAAAEELRNTFNDAFGGNKEQMSSAAYNFAEQLANSGYNYDTGEGGSDYARRRLEYILRANPNSRFQSIEDIMNEYKAVMGRYDELTDDEFFMSAASGGTTSDSSGSLTGTTSAMATDTSKAISANNVVNSNNTTTNNYNYTQNNYSPEPIDRITIYRQTEIALGMVWDNQ